MKEAWTLEVTLEIHLKLTLYLSKTFSHHGEQCMKHIDLDLMNSVGLLFIYLFEILKTLTMSHTFTMKGAEVIKVFKYN